MICFDSDDFGANHVISDMCQAHDCRKQLDMLHVANFKFKATLFAIPGEMTPELLRWCYDNRSWIELAFHGFFHSSNYECEKMSYEQVDAYMGTFNHLMNNPVEHFVKGFKAPGWQISDDIYRWLKDNDYWVADQAYNDDRRPKDLPVYIVGDNSIHTHTWNCVGNGIEETFNDILARVKDEPEFKFVSEMVQ